jgi:putative hydrolase of HD superfamily
MTNDRDIEFLFEIGSMRNIARAWVQFGGNDFSNLAEHTLRVTWIALLISKYEGGNQERILKLALMHDLGETRSGDIHYVSRIYTDRDESKAIYDTVKNTAFESEAIELQRELEENTSIEARIVKDADIIDCDLELLEQFYNGVRLRESMKEVRIAASKKLTTATAKSIFSRVVLDDINPHNWHMRGSNRFNNGDWSE